jgi:SAM-dependent methyltransferase
VARPDSFNEVAQLYNEVRPGYAPALIEALASHARLSASSRILEIGAGTGQLTVPLAALGCRILALEPGGALARCCRANCEPYPGVEVIEQRFEDYVAEAESFDLVASAQAFHWIEPAWGFSRAAELLKPGGHLALLWHLDVSEHTAFYAATQPAYDRCFPPQAVRKPDSLQYLTEVCARELAHSPAFEPLTEIRHRWSQTYAQPAWLKILQTHSPVLGLESAARAAFLEEIGHVIQLQGGTVEREYETLLLMAQRL